MILFCLVAVCTPPAWAEEKSILEEAKSYVLLGTLFGLAHQSGKDDLFYEWDSGIQSQGGRPISCYLRLLALKDDFRVLTLHLHLNRPRTNLRETRFSTALKVTVKQTNPKDHLKGTVPIPVKDAWIESSTGTSVGQLHRGAADINTDFLAFGKPDLWEKIFSGIVDSGATVGYQTKSDEFDTTFRIAQPPASSVLTKVLECVSRLEKEFALKGTPGE